ADAMGAATLKAEPPSRSTKSVPRHAESLMVCRIVVQVNRIRNARPAVFARPRDRTMNGHGGKRPGAGRPKGAGLACPVFEVFFGGARGGGKTDGMLGEWASHADLHGKNAVGLMVRRERVQLLETIERSREIYGPLGARYNDQDKMWRWP